MKPKLLFLCTGNSCRSQMAEGWAKHLLGHKYDIYSAGIEKHGMNPSAVKVMAEADIDISGHYSKTLDELETASFELIATVCDNAKETCPSHPATMIHHSFDDPPALARSESDPVKAMGHYRRVRDEIKTWVDQLN